VVSGIWPPDVGGPASHAPEVAAFLAARGHGVEAVTTAERAPAPEDYPVHWISRALPPGIRHVRGAALVAARARRAGVVYTTGMEGRSAVGSFAARTPFVLKLTSDPAFERARRRGHHAGTIDSFQSERSLLTAVRNAEVRRAAHVVTPSAYLGELARRWGARRVTVLPNPAPPVGPLRPREELRAELGVDGPTVAFAGRLTRQKSLEVALDALALVPGLTLLVAGEGDERAALERRAAALDDRVRFLGPLARLGVLELFHAADAAVLPSRWENFPHTVVEALAVGTPVVATRTGGVEEIVEDGRNGLLVPAGDAEALAAALRRLPAEGERLRAAAAPSVERFAAERVYGELERILEDAAR
jgi:glycosyltransferase involved in cell wall biosynthesis